MEEEEVDNYEESRMVVAKWWRWLELELALSAADVTTVEEGSDGSGTTPPTQTTPATSLRRWLISRC